MKQPKSEEYLQKKLNPPILSFAAGMYCTDCDTQHHTIIKGEENNPQPAINELIRIYKEDYPCKKLITEKDIRIYDPTEV